MKKQYSKESLSGIFERILEFEEDVKTLYDDCIKKLDDKSIIDVLNSISKEEKGHIVLAKELMEIIRE